MPHAIPHSIFLGRVPARGEPYWLPDDQDKALAWLADQAEFCLSCGTRPDDWLHEGRPIEPPPFRVGRHRCIGCERLQEDQEALGAADAALTRGVTAALVPNLDGRDA